jgi:hypothetical protein
MRWTASITLISPESKSAVAAFTSDRASTACTESLCSALDISHLFSEAITPSIWELITTTDAHEGQWRFRLPVRLQHGPAERRFSHFGRLFQEWQQWVYLPAPGKA